MKTYYLKVREKFIEEVRFGNKKHEYRLATQERKAIKTGDVIVLVSNQNKRYIVKTMVKGIKYYADWESALECNWQDFSHLYANMEEALHECYKFYKKEQVDKYGIVVFEIEPLIIKDKFENILIDTNIIIKRESGNNVSYEVANLYNWFAKEKVFLFIHQASKKEIENYQDEKAKNVILTKLNAYNELPSFKKENDQFFNNIICKYSQDENGKIDNTLLREIYDYNIDLLVTDDVLMLRKAEELYIRDRVKSSSELLVYFETLYPQNIEYKMLAVKLKCFAEVDLNEKFFDTLREEYEGKKFDDWFKKKALHHEKAYVFEDKEGLKGFLYLKIENEKEDYSEINPGLSPKKRLKIGTFKIESSGFRLGERFLKIIFDNAKRHKVDEIYVTLYEEKREEVVQLQNLMMQWGFVKHGYKSNGEVVLIKNLQSYNENNSPKQNFPLIKRVINNYFLPIYPQYHTDLFPDMILNNEDMHLYEENKAHRYALEKIYLTGAFNIKAKPGDLVLIYRNGERYPKRYSSVVTGVAIIEEILYTKSVEECLGICKNRSIFSEQEIRKVYSTYNTVLKLLDAVTFKNKVTLNELYENNIIEKNKGPRPFTSITKEQYDIIYKLGMEE